MKTLSGSLRHHAEPTKGSRFIASVAPAATEADARLFLDGVRAEMPDASHHCWAWRLATPAIDRAGDDGEPSGSAGRPILAQLTGRELVNVAAVVTRYFGGTKLGVGGLVRAYGGAAGEALDAAATIDFQALTTLTVEHDYALADAIDRAVGRTGATIVETTYAASVCRRIEVAEREADTLRRAIADASAGRAVILAEE